MLLIVGLGNPGQGYADNRHNVGFAVVDRLADHLGLDPEKSKFHGILREGRAGEMKILVLRPQTFMNRSGLSVGQAVRFYKLTPEEVLVVYDEIDLALGKLKLKRGGGHAGHNGIRDIIAHIGPDFRRLRIGVGHPGNRAHVKDHVLSGFSASERPVIEGVIDAVVACSDTLISGDDPRFMSDVALRLQGDKKSGAADNSQSPADG